MAIYGAADEEVHRLIDLAGTHVELPGGESVGHVVLATLARMALFTFDTATAKAHLETAAPMRSAAEALARPDILLASADIAMAEGDIERASGFVEELRRHVQDTGAVILEPRLVQAIGLLQMHQEDFDGAIESFDAAAEQAAGFGLLFDLLGIQFRAATMLGAAGRPEAERFGEAAADTVADIAALIDDAELREAFLRTNAAR